MTTEQLERLEKLRERKQQAISAAIENYEFRPLPTWGDIDFILDLLDSQAAGARSVPTAISVVEQMYNEWWDNDRRHCLDTILARLKSLPPNHETNDTATAMRSRCVEKVRLAGMWCDECGHKSAPNADGSCSTYGYNGVDCQTQPCVCRIHWPATQHYNKLIASLEAVTLEQQEKQS